MEDDDSGKGGKKRNRFFHDEADESDGEDVEENDRKKKGKADSEVEDNDDNEYQEDGFVVADNSENEAELKYRGEDTSSDEDQQDGRLKKNKRKKTLDLDDLDDDDLEIAGFAHSSKYAIPKETEGIDFESGPGSSDDEAEPKNKTKRKVKTIVDDIDGDGGQSDSVVGVSGAATPRKSSSYGDAGYDSMDDFIEKDDDDEASDDEPYGDEHRIGPAVPLHNQEDSLNFRDAVAIFGMDLDDLDLGYEEEDAAGYDDREDPSNEDHGDSESGGQKISAAERLLRKRYDPAVLRSHYVTTKDDEVRRMDMPERLAHRVDRNEVQDEERVYEAQFIAKHILARRYRKKPSDIVDPRHQELKTAVYNVEKSCYEVLEKLHLGYEVPFIAAYRPDEYQPHLSRYDLWRIFDLDSRWERLASRRVNLDNIANKVRELMPESNPGTNLPTSGSTTHATFQSQDKLVWCETQQKLVTEEATAAKAAEAQAGRVLAEARQSRLTAVAEVQKAERAVSMAQNVNANGAQDAMSAELQHEMADAGHAELQQAQANAANAEAEVQMAQQVWAFASKKADAAHQGVLRASAPLNNAKAEVHRGSPDEGTNDATSRAMSARGPDRSELPDDIYHIWKSLELVNEEDLDDAQVYLRVMQEAVVGAVSGAGAGAGSSYRKRTVKRPWLDLDLYRRCVAYGLKPLARLFTLPAARMGQVMKDGGLDVPPTPSNSITPLELARRFVKRDVPEVNSPKRVLAAVRSMAAMEIACEPRIRGIMRRLYEGGRYYDKDQQRVVYSGATLTTQPTLKGRAEIDLFHRFHGIQHITEKPVAVVLEDAQYACMREDEADDSFCEMPGVSAVEVERAPLWELQDGFAGASYANPYNKNSDVRYHTGYAERKQSLHTLVQQAKQEGYLTASLDPPPGDGNTKCSLFIDPFIDAGAIIGKIRGDEISGREAFDAWNGQRLMIIEEAVNARILPSLKSGLEAKLRIASKMAIVHGAARRFRKRYLAKGPFRPAEQIVDRALYLTSSGTGIKVVAVSVSDNRQMGDVFVALNEHGGVRTHLTLPPMRRPRRDPRFATETNSRGRMVHPDEDQIKEFLFLHQPNLIAVTTSAGNGCKTMKEYLEELAGVIKEESEERMDFDEDELDWQPEVHFVVDDIASIFAKSPRADVELKDYTNVNIRKAISIGRFVQEPLAEVAYMWGGATDTSASIRGDEVLFLSLHPLFHKVNKSFLLGFLERELIITVNDAGVNLNAAIQNQHRHAQLSFVCGLGKIKAHDMVNKIKKMGGGMISRKVDLREKAILGRLVFANAAGFLRIRDFPSVHLNPVDDTRIHPETYLPVEKDGLGHNLLQTMIQHALNDHVDADQLGALAPDDDASWGEFALHCINMHRNHYCHAEMGRFRGTVEDPDFPDGDAINFDEWSPRELWQCKSADDFDYDDQVLDDALGQLDLSAYAEEVRKTIKNERGTEVNALRKLQHMKAELRFPFRDRRPPYDGPDDLEKFEALAGEPISALPRGLMVGCRVTRADKYGVSVRIEELSSALVGQIRLQETGDEDLKNQRPESLEAIDVEKKFPLDSLHRCTILSVDIRRFKVQLSLDSYRCNWNGVEKGDDRSDTAQGADFTLALYMERAREGHVGYLWEDGRCDVGVQYRLFVDDFCDILKCAEDYESNLKPLVQPAKARMQQDRANRYSKVYHPNFVKPPQFLEARAQLERSKKSGGFYFRPKTSSENVIELAWAFQPGMIRCFEVIEEQKKTPLVLGSLLKITYAGVKEEYESLEEIIARFVEPMNDLVKEIISMPHKKFVSGSMAEATSKLRARVQPDGRERGAYGIHFAGENEPGKFCLSFLEAYKGTKQHKLRVTPAGLMNATGDLFGSVNEAINFYKRGEHKKSRPVAAPGPNPIQPELSLPPAQARVKQRADSTGARPSETMQISYPMHPNAPIDALPLNSQAQADAAAALAILNPRIGSPDGKPPPLGVWPPQQRQQLQYPPQPPMGRGRGRGQSNLPAWMEKK